MIHPTENRRITSNYGFREIGGRLDYHGGTDYGPKVRGVGGDPIRAITSNSKVVEIKSDQWRGNYVVLEHLEHCTLYAHLQDVLCKVGDELKEGDVFATMGTTGNSTGVHLHHEVRKCRYKHFWERWSNNEYKYTIDPEKFYMQYMDNVKSNLEKECSKLLNKLNEIYK